jgi:hypothetical protein
VVEMEVDAEEEDDEEEEVVQTGLGGFAGTGGLYWGSNLDTT